MLKEIMAICFLILAIIAGVNDFNEVFWGCFICSQIWAAK